MKKTAMALLCMCFALTSFGGFKAKRIKPKKPDQFQCLAAVSGVTYAADLLLDGKEQKKYFYEALDPFNLVAVRLAVFNNGKEEIVLPLDQLQLLAPEGFEFSRVSPETVAKTVLGEESLITEEESRLPQIGIGSGGGADPRRDPSDPRYDPRMDPSDPRYDPQDPRNRDSYPTGPFPPATTPGTYPDGRYPTGGPSGNPGIVLNPGGGGMDQYKNERKLIAVDFRNKAHTFDPIVSSLCRDRFLYFSMTAKPSTKKGITLVLPVSKGIHEEIVLKF